jgi:hypothetical protein
MKARQWVKYVVVSPQEQGKLQLSKGSHRWKGKALCARQQTMDQKAYQGCLLLVVIPMCVIVSQGVIRPASAPGNEKWSMFRM